MECTLTPYFNGIESIILDSIQDSKKSIKIAMAWFTNQKIIDVLIKKKLSDQEVAIEIVVDDNETNEKYFHKFKEQFLAVGIIVRVKLSNKFLHHKFIVIDSRTVVLGSYNMTQKAKSNLENMNIINCEKVATLYTRVFEFLSMKNYIDENIQLLFENTEFAREMISTYYKFNKKEFLKYKNKLTIGECYTYPVGDYDQIAYTPGLIFNAKCKFYKKMPVLTEFKLPINKNIIKEWTIGRDVNLILDSYRDIGGDYSGIDEDLENAQKDIENYFRNKIKSTYNYSELSDLIINHVDIIIEDMLWTHNFELFINGEIVELIFENIDEIKHPDYSDLPF